jgi:hypothetical protein
MPKGSAPIGGLGLPFLGQIIASRCADFLLSRGWTGAGLNAGGNSS